MSPLASAFADVIRAAAMIPVGAARSLTCALAGHRPHSEWAKVCGRCGTDLPPNAFWLGYHKAHVQDGYDEVDACQVCHPGADIPLEPR